MSLNTFPAEATSIGIVGGGIRVYSDVALTQRVTLFNTNGQPLVGNALNIPSSGRIPTFQAAGFVVYVAAAGGEVVALTASAARTAPVVTGAKGGNAAFASLMSALAALGIVVDQTT